MFLRVLDIYVEMQKKGISRKQALENIGETEEKIQKHVGPVRRALERGKVNVPKPKRGPRVHPRG
jgi:hypothetical protein